MQSVRQRRLFEGNYEEVRTEKIEKKRSNIITEVMDSGFGEINEQSQQKEEARKV